MDIRNFTALSEELPPQILCEILNQIFDCLYRAVNENGGTIDKFLGDGALVTWGAVPGSVVDANSAVRAATKFIENVRELSQQLVLKGLREIGLGIGIDQGVVVAGNMGTHNRLEYTVIGNTVNRASRLEQITKVMKTPIVISQDVYNALEDKSSWTVHEKVQIRGIELPVNVAAFKHDTGKREAA
jgi:adenylate cyclase